MISAAWLRFWITFAFACVGIAWFLALPLGWGFIGLIGCTLIGGHFGHRAFLRRASPEEILADLRDRADRND